MPFRRTKRAKTVSQPKDYGSPRERYLKDVRPRFYFEESYSISAGLDFPSVGPQHAFLNSTGRADYVSITDDEALEAFKTLCRNEGIIPALESSHALAHALKMMKENPEKEQLLVVNLSGRGDKDIFTVHDILKARGEI